MDHIKNLGLDLKTRAKIRGEQRKLVESGPRQQSKSSEGMKKKPETEDHSQDLFHLGT